MRINLCLIVEELKKICEIENYCMKFEQMNLDTVLMRTKENVFYNHSITVGRGDEFSKEPIFEGRCAVISIGKLPEIYKTGKCDYVEIAEGVLPEEIANNINMTYRFYDNWHKKVYDMVFSGRGIQSILDASIKVFNNPIYYHDMRYRILAYSIPRGVENPYKTDDEGYFDPAQLQLLAHTPGYADTFDSKGPVYWQGSHEDGENWNVKDGTGNYIFCNIRKEKSVVGRLFIDEINSRITEKDYYLLEILVKLIETMIKRRNFYIDKSANRFEFMLKSLLSGEPVNMNELKEEMLANGITENEKYYLIKIEKAVSSRDFSDIYSFCEFFERHIEYSYFFGNNDDIIGLIQLNGRKASDIQKLFEGHSKLLGLVVGISKTFDDILDLRLALSQAEFALEEGKKTQKESDVYVFGDYLLDFFVSRCAQRTEYKQLCPRGLRVLREYDKNNNGELFDTFRAFLENNEKSSKTIEALFVHRSTFLYRINKIKEIMGEDFDNPDFKLCYLIYYKLMDKYEKG